jgi:hypothetical protein
VAVHARDVIGGFEPDPFGHPGIKGLLVTG